MATQIKISELPLANESALSLAADDRFIFNNDNVNTQTIKFANFVDAICEQNLTFSGNCSFLQPITGPNGGDIQVGLDDLVDVQFQNVTSGQIITYSGTQWINRDVKDIALQLDSLSVVISDTPSGGGSLAYDNTTGVFTFTPSVQGTFTPSSISVTTSSAASGGGALDWNPTSSVFTFTPADAYTKAESYNQTQVDAALAAKADAASTYTKNEVDSALGAKATNYLLGVANGATNMGDFTGTTIQPNQNAKQCLQDLETQLDTTSAAVAGKADTGVSYTKAEADAAFAPATILADAALTGTPTAPTAGGGNDSTQVASTAFVQQELASYAPLAGPALTGVPTAPTAAAGANTTQIATTEFVTTAVAGLDAAALRGLLGIKSGADAGGAGAASGELFFNTGSNTYVVAA